MRSSKRFYCAEAFAPSVPDGAEKQYSDKIERIVEEISALHLHEVADLNELLKVKIRINISMFIAEVLF